MASRKRGISDDADVSALYKEWDEALCPICMDHPHNAVLLLCSSHDKGCRSYICDTSYRHSNCLDRFRKLKEENAEGLSPTHLMLGRNHDSAYLNGTNDDLTTSTSILREHVNHTMNQSNSVAYVDAPEGSGGHRIHEADPSSGEQDGTLQRRLDLEELNMETLAGGSKLSCPLCRGSVLGWKVVDDARKYLNLKSRSCSHESCSFFGNYSELRSHARSVHPTVRPGNVDPTRQRAWRNLEDQQEYSDIVSAIRSAVPGAVVIGDYMIENGDRVLGERDQNLESGENDRLLSIFFLFQMIGSLNRRAELRIGRSRVLPRPHRAGETFSRRRYLWGENLLGLQDDNDEEEEEDGEDDEPDLNIPSDLGDNGSSNPRRRRRLTGTQSDEDQQ